MCLSSHSGSSEFFVTSIMMSMFYKILLLIAINRKCGTNRRPQRAWKWIELIVLILDRVVNSHTLYYAIYPKGRGTPTVVCLISSAGRVIYTAVFFHSRSSNCCLASNKHRYLFLFSNHKTLLLNFLPIVGTMTQCPISNYPRES